MPQMRRPPLEALLESPRYYFEHGLRKVAPYNFTFTTYAKERWLGRSVVEVFCTEFRRGHLKMVNIDKLSLLCTTRQQANEPSVLERIQGTIRVNDMPVDDTYKLNNGDLITNIMHRHEPPVVGQPIHIIHRDDQEGLLVVEKPGSMPVHPTGRYQHNTLISILKADLNLEKVHTSNRLDRLTSGVMICTTKLETTKQISNVFKTEGAVFKEYVCRATGYFPDETVCEEPMLTIDRQNGVNVVHPEGRHAKTSFRRLSYHSQTDTSVIRCKPYTGRSHQIRVHLQYLGHPIANDPLYNNSRAWGPNVGRGGIFQNSIDNNNNNNNADPSSSKTNEVNNTSRSKEYEYERDHSGRDASRKIYTYHNEDGSILSTGSSVPISDQAARAITELRKRRDNEERYCRERDSNPEYNMNQKSKYGETSFEVHDEQGNAYCNTCGVPIIPDPTPEKLFIWLHAIRYRSEYWDYSSELPYWARENWDPKDAEVSAMRKFVPQ